MTVTTITNQSVGTGANVGIIAATKTALLAVTTAFIISARFTPGAGHEEGTIRIYYTSASFDESAANGPARLGKTARYLDLVLNPAEVGIPLIRDGSLEVATGPNVHVWVEMPPLAVAGTLEINLVQQP